MSSSALIPNPWNSLLAQKHAGLANAERYQIGTLCDPTGNPIPPSGPSLRKQLKTIQINATLAGDNIIIPALAGEKAILEVVMWNTAAQDLRWQQGASGDTPITLLDLPGFPATTGLTLGFNGNFDESHWDVDNNQPLVLKTSAGSQVTGFIRYRIVSGAN